MWCWAHMSLPKRHFCSTWCFFQQYCFTAPKSSSSKCKKNNTLWDLKVRQLTEAVTLHVSEKKKVRLVTRNPFWRENTSTFISVGIHSRERTHFVLSSDYIHAKQYLILSSSGLFCCFIFSFKINDSCKQSKIRLKALNAQKLTYAFSMVHHCLTALHWSSRSDPQLQHPLGSCSEFYCLIVLPVLRG